MPMSAARSMSSLNLLIDCIGVNVRCSFRREVFQDAKWDIPVIRVDGIVTILIVGYFARDVRESVPDRRASAIGVPCTLDLIGRSGC